MHNEIEDATEEPEYNSIKLTARGARQNECGERREEREDDGDKPCNEYKIMEQVFHRANYNRVVKVADSGAILAR